MRYILKVDKEEFVSWIYWVTGTVPRLKTSIFEEALVVNDRFLNEIIEKVGKTRRELIRKKYPNVQIMPIELNILEKAIQ